MRAAQPHLPVAHLGAEPLVRRRDLLLAHQAQGLRHAGVRQHSDTGVDPRPGLDRAFAQNHAGSPPVLDDDPIDRAVGQDRSAVPHEALGEGVDLHLVAADADPGRVVERERDPVGALPARERRAVLPERDRGHQDLAARIRFEGALAQLRSGHLRHLVDAEAHRVGADLEDAVELGRVGVGREGAQLVELDHRLVHALLDAEHALAVVLGVLREVLAVRSGSWQIRQLVPSRNVVARITGLALKRNPYRSRSRSSITGELPAKLTPTCGLSSVCGQVSCEQQNEPSSEFASRTRTSSPAFWR